MKRIVSLYLEADVIDRLKRDGVNISELVSKFLHDFTKPSATPADSCTARTNE